MGRLGDRHAPKSETDKLFAWAPAATATPNSKLAPTSSAGAAPSKPLEAAAPFKHLMPGQRSTEA